MTCDWSLGMGHGVRGRGSRVTRYDCMRRYCHSVRTQKTADRISDTDEAVRNVDFVFRSVCKNRNWICEKDPEADCNNVCWASGDPHYRTFDGVHFNYEVYSFCNTTTNRP